MRWWNMFGAYSSCFIDWSTLDYTTSNGHPYIEILAHYHDQFERTMFPMRVKRVIM